MFDGPAAAEVVEQPVPVGIGRAHALDLGAADRIEQRGDLVA